MLENSSELFERVRQTLIEYGILLHSDSRLPSMVNIVAGEAVHGSWWSHPKSRLIFQIGVKLSRDKDTMIAKLVSGKETYIHRSLWSPLVAVGTSRETWQLRQLSSEAIFLLETVESRGQLKTHEFAEIEGIDSKKLGDAARQLERRLLVRSKDIHTERGFHAKHLMSWPDWLRSVAFLPERIKAEDARQIFEKRVNSLNQKFNADVRLPWSSNSILCSGVFAPRQAPLQSSGTNCRGSKP